jgi:hypothetical protein
MCYGEIFLTYILDRMVQLILMVVKSTGAKERRKERRSKKSHGLLS